MVRVTLTATHGKLWLSGTTGLTFTVGNGSDDATMTFSGTLADVNAALDGLAFKPSGIYNGPATIQITTNDQGNSGSGGALSDTDTVNVSIGAVNDPPVNSVPPAQQFDEDTTLIFSPGSGNAISVSDLDVDEGTGLLRVTLTATHGRLTLGQLAGLTFSAGDGTSDVTMTFSGTTAAINAALDGLGFAPDANYNGPATLTITTNDLGNFGMGGALSDTDVVNLTIDPVNDAPTSSVPGAQVTNEDTNLVFTAGNGNGISVDDIDAGSGDLQVTLSVTHGTLTAGQPDRLDLRRGRRQQATRPSRSAARSPTSTRPCKA
jgi:hypothetical protein